MDEHGQNEPHWIDRIENSPVCLVVSWLHHKAWLLLDEYYLGQYSEEEIEQYDAAAKKWGVRSCRSPEEYTRHLTSAKQKVAEVQNKVDRTQYQKGGLSL